MRATIVVAAAVFLLLTQVLPHASRSESELGVGAQAPTFVLEDAFGARYQLGELRGAYVILLFGHRELRQENRRLAETFQARYGRRPDVRTFMIADLRGVPFLIPKGVVRSRIRAEKLPVPLLLDWNQEVNTLFGADPKKIDIFVVGPHGTIVLRKQTNGLVQGDVTVLIEQLETVLSGQQPSPFATVAVAGDRTHLSRP